MSMEENHELVNQEDTSRGANQEPKIWRSCCLRVDKSIVVYFSQLTIGILVLVFASIQLIEAKFECDKSSPYLSLISFVLGTYVARISK